MGSELQRWGAMLLDPGLAAVLLLTLQVAAGSAALHLVLGVGLAQALARPAWPGRRLLDLLVTLPLVFPPMAIGFVLLLVLGRHGLVGRLLHDWASVDVMFSRGALVLAAFVAGLPLVVKPVQAALEALAADLAEAARTLGKGEMQIFWHVLLPNVRGALVTGLVLGTGRALGEVGITLMLGGNIEGRTVTASLAIFNAVQSADFERAGLLSLVLGACTVGLYLMLLGAQAPRPRWPD